MKYLINSYYSNSTINYRLMFRLLGQLLMVEAAFMAVPMVVSLLYGESDWSAFAMAVSITLAAGSVFYIMPRPKNRILKRRDGMLLSSLTWVVFSLFGMLPFVFCETQLNVSEAFFEAMSGFTTTGATVIRNVECCSNGILLWRAITQWIGGLGIVLFTLMFISALNNNGSIMLYRAESTGITHDKLAARLSITAKMLWGLYAILTVALILLLWCGPMNLFDSVCHAFSCISTGGYSTRNDSIAAFNSPYVKLVLTLFMFVGGTSFGLIIVGLKRSVREIWRNDVFRAYLLAVLVYYALMVFAIIYRDHYTGWESVTIDPLFHIVSAMTSTGFSAGNWEGWGILVLTLTFFMMYVGACAGSTTGGAKFDRLLYLVKNLRSAVRKYVRPRLVTSVDVNGQYINSEISSEISAFIFIYTLLVIFGGMVLVVHGFPIVDAFFSSVSCISNNGLGAGVTGITGSFDLLPASGMWVMSLLMLAGRLEIFTLIAIFSPSFWRESIYRSKI